MNTLVNNVLKKDMNPNMNKQHTKLFFIVVVVVCCRKLARMVHKTSGLNQRCSSGTQGKKSCTC